MRARRVCTLQENLDLVVEETSDKSGCSGHMLQASNFKLQTTPFSYLNLREGPRFIKILMDDIWKISRNLNIYICFI